MSSAISNPTIRRRLPAAAVAAALLAGGVVFIVGRRHDALRAPTGSATRPVPDRVVVSAAPWRIRSFPSGGTLRASERAGFARQTGRIRALIVETYDASFLREQPLRAVVRRAFAKPAAAAFLDARAGLPKGARKVRLVRRNAQIGIAADEARRAAARVEIVATGRFGGKGRQRLIHTSTLWLHRERGTWSVIGFELTRERVERRRERSR